MGISDKGENIKGKVKQAVGSLTGNKKMEAEGAAERAKGAAKEKIHETEEKIRESEEKLRGEAEEKKSAGSSEDVELDTDYDEED